MPVNVQNYSHTGVCNNWYLQATGSKIGQVLEAASTLATAITIAFVYGWKLAFVVLSFMPLMILAGLIQGRVIAGAAKKDRAQLQQAGKVRIALLNVRGYIAEQFCLYDVRWDIAEQFFFFFLTSKSGQGNVCCAF